MMIKAFAVNKLGGNLEPFQYSANLDNNDVTIKISHCALGTPDIFFIDNFWGETQYPLIPGYEIVGTVETCGKNVSSLKTGDRVGIGYQVNSCGKCQFCLSGQENICQHGQFIGINHFGGLADKIIVNHRFAFKLPENMNSTTAALLMCSGLTPYAAIKKAYVKSTMNTGVIGIGGLGHLAVKILDKIGCQVTAFSSSNNKSSLDLGFDRFVLNTNSDNFNQLFGTFDYLISTVPAEINWPQYLKLLKPNGILSIVGLPKQDVHFPAISLADYGEKTIKGGFIGTRKQMKDLLGFAAKNKIEAKVEEFSISQVNEVLDKIRNKEILFKAVIKL
jgi:uncharacterized zinc-type alcohol dehydrogenase-like protein